MHASKASPAMTRNRKFIVYMAWLQKLSSYTERDQRLSHADLQLCGEDAPYWARQRVRTRKKGAPSVATARTASFFSSGKGGRMLVAGQSK